MTRNGWRDDDDLLADLRAAVEHAGEPTEKMSAAADAAFSWRTVDAELAVLTRDSLDEEAALVRSTTTPPRSLVFEGRGLAVEIETTADGVEGQLVPPGPGEVTVMTPQGELARTRTDELGCFSLAGLGPGPLRLRCATTSTTVVTEWVHL
ncbi:MAG: hypothetical protein ACRDPR_21530 [Nocardioidaceae bacterium]